MDSQSSNLSSLLSEKTFKFLEEQISDSWSNFEEFQELTALKSKNLNRTCSNEDLENDAHSSQNEKNQGLADEILDLSQKDNLHLELGKYEKVKGISFPSSERMMGKYGFDVIFREAARITKSISYTYSERLETLFVRPQIPCYAVVSSSGCVPFGTKIFLTPMFLLSHHANDPVRACPNHMMDKPDKNASRHLIRLDVGGAVYGIHPGSEHHYVCIDYHAVSNGKGTFNIPLKFQCYSTCLGGIARRQFQVIYWLQNKDQVIGRKSVKTVVCASPGRDKRSRETEKFGSGILESKKAPQGDKKDNNENSEYQGSKLKRSNSCLNIKVQNQDEYSLLMKLRTHLREHSGTSCSCKQIFLPLF